MYTYSRAFLGVPLCHALLANKQRATYIRLFTIIRDNVHRLLNHFPSMHHVLLDFEMAAHDAVQDVFGIRATGCTFHLGQCFLRWIETHGLKLPYQDENSGIRLWTRQIRALCLLPPDLVLFTWDQWLRFPPPVQSVRHRQLLNEFVQYVEVSRKRLNIASR